MKHIGHTLAALAMLGGLGGCATQEQSGMLVGAVVGGVVGSHIGSGSGEVAATFLGTVIGANIGGSIGRQMDDSDRLRVSLVLQNVHTSVPARWANPRTRIVYTMVPTRTYTAPTGPCRDYSVDALVDGRVERVTGTACLQPDGSWRVLN
jgi:surface antigen